MAARPRLVEALFLEVVDLPEGERARVLDERCGGDDELRREVDSYLAADEANADGRLEEPAHDVWAEEDPRRVAGYRIVGVIGQGAMGTVYEAEQERPHRTVAVKLIRPGLGSRAMMRRFELEAEALGRLRHPGIAHVYEAGLGRVEYSTSAADRPFIAMELIRGRTLLDDAEGRGLDVPARLEMAARIAEAVHHAHQAGLIHRDLKPGNILVEEGGQPKVLDFGAARLTEAAAGGTQQTATGQVIGTLQYMSPEQATDSSSIDTRSDVYSLGVVLYELLTGKLPIEVSTHSLAASFLRIQQEEPRPLESHDPSLRGDVSTIVRKALERDRDRRYASVLELAADLRRFLRHEPIHARPPTRLYQLEKFVRRHRGLVAGAASVFLVLVAGIIGTAVYAGRESEARDRAQRLAYATLIDSAGLALDRFDAAHARRFLDDAPDPLRGWEWEHLATRLDRSASARRFDERELQSSLTLPIEFDEEGRRAMLVYHVKQVGAAGFAWDTATGSPLGMRTLAAPETYSAQGLPGASRLAVLSGEGEIAIASIGDESIEAAAVADASFDSTVVLRHPDREDSWLARYRGLVLFRSSRDGDWGFLDPDHLGEVSGVGAAIALFHDGTTLRVHRLDSGAPLLSVPVGHASTCRFSPDGSRLAVGTARGELSVWSLADGARLWLRVEDEAGELFALDFSVDGRWLVSGGARGSVRQRDAATGDLVRVLDAGGGAVLAARFSPDGQSLIVATDEGHLRTWDADPADPLVLAGHDGFVYPVVVSPDGTRAASGAWDGTVRVWELATGVELVRIELDDPDSSAPPNAYALAYTPDGERLVVSYGQHEWWHQEAAVFDAETGVAVAELEGGTVIALASEPRRGLLAVAVDGEARILDASTYREVARFESNGRVSAFSPDGPPRFATTTRDGEFREVAIFDLDSRERVAVLRGHTAEVSAAAFSPDGRRVATASHDATVRVWDAATGDELAVLRSHTGEVFDVAFSPDGKRIASGGRDGLVHLWDAQELTRVGGLRGHDSYVYSLSWSRPDGERLVTGSGDRTVRIWETRSMAERIRARRERRAIVERIGPRLRELLDAALDPSSAVEALASELALDERGLEVARQLALRPVR